jgi:CDP-paratose 2-epimerase
MSCIYGDRQFGVEDQGWVVWFTIATSTVKPITIDENGKQVRDVLYIDDLLASLTVS